ncbi:MAG: hypothetical protein GC180_07590 [Bacteroidetes bacterium]|nr:hypothetical protein [Bacteroidota bacterium]
MSEYLNREQRTILVKFLAYLGLVRWQNLGLVALAQYLAAVFLLNRHTENLEVLMDPGLHFVVLSSGFIIAGGYLINAFYDMEKDLANNPDKLIIGRIISKTFALNTYLLFNFIGLLIGFLISWRIFLFLGIFTFLLWFYSHKLKKMPFVGNLSGTFLSVCSFFVICVYYWQLSWPVVWYVMFLILAELIREIVKDMEAIKGDIVFGYKTISIVLGIKRTKLLVYGLMTLGILPIALVYHLQGWSIVMYFFLFASLLWIIAAMMLGSAKERKDFAAVNTLLKVIIVLGVLSIGLV